MIKSLEQTNYIQLNDKEILFIVGKPNVGKSIFLAKEAYYASKEHKILYFSLEMSKESLLKYYNEQRWNNENITFIDETPFMVENIENYIKEDTKYIYIDYFNLLESNYTFSNNNDKTQYILDKLKSYTIQYNVKFLIMNNISSNDTIEETKEKYTSDIFKNVNGVWNLLKDTMIRIK